MTAPAKPAELYELSGDPYQMKNLAAGPRQGLLLRRGVQLELERGAAGEGRFTRWPWPAGLHMLPPHRQSGRST